MRNTEFNFEIKIIILTMNSRNDQETSVTENFQVHVLDTELLNLSNKWRDHFFKPSLKLQFTNIFFQH